MLNRTNSNCDIDLKKVKYRFWAIYISVELSALSIVPIAFIPDDIQGFSFTALISMLGVVAFGIIAFLLCHSITSIRKKYERIQDDNIRRIIEKVFALSFFTNKTASVFDILLIASFVYVSLDQLAIGNNEVYLVLQNEVISICSVIGFILSLEFHMMFNGKNYNFYCAHFAKKAKH
jgi:hypothetical protein